MGSVPSTAQHSLSKIMMKFILLISLACLLSSATAALKPSDVAKVKDTFMDACNTDGVEGVSWLECQKCITNHKKIMKENGMSKPTKKDFDSVDTNHNGIICQGEWKEFTKQF